MNCRHCEQQLSAYLDGELTGTEMIRVQRHLDGCNTCQLELEAERLTKQSLMGLQDQELPTGFEERLLKAVFEQVAPRPTLWQRFAPFAITATVTAVVVYSGIAWNKNQQIAAQSAEELQLNVARDQAISTAASPFSPYAPIYVVGTE